MPTAWKIGLKSLYLRRNYTHPKSVISSLVQGDGSRQSIPCIFYSTSCLFFFLILGTILYNSLSPIFILTISYITVLFA